MVVATVQLTTLCAMVALSLMQIQVPAYNNRNQTC